MEEYNIRTSGLFRISCLFLYISSFYGSYLVGLIIAYKVPHPIMPRLPRMATFSNKDIMYFYPQIKKKINF